MRSLIPFVVLAAMLATSACQSPTDYFVEATRESEVFHDLYNRGEFAEIWERADESLKGSTSREDFVAFLEEQNTRLGRVIVPTRRGGGMDRRNDRDVALVRFQTVFERGELTEMFTFSIEKPAPQLIEYATREFVRKDGEKQPNQALQTTPMTRSVCEKIVEFGHRRRGV